VATGTVPYL